ncbi:Eco57I restriction-modification methylase domain-containing protein [Aquibacillus halophilus]|uniref:Eco57I restriction-modification methylase domain-containing protein n=1 Tax=Aquibacillus halophilus TaxID=930132 RepID=UPI001478FD5C|nr:N-6 DNA methylase [Aquibacillus halophilus]
MEKTVSQEESYIKSTTLSHRKQLGQYFTPDFISNVLAEWITTNKSFHGTILDPAIGLGNLIKPFPIETPIVGFDRDKNILDHTRKTCSDFSNLQLHHQDFLESTWEQSYDGVVCNPPYLRFRQNEKKQHYLELFEQKLGIKFSGFTNIYTLFIIKALNQLSSNGKASFIVPSDFLNSDYGIKIKKYLLQHTNLHLIVVADFHLNWFDQAATTSSLFFFDNQVEANRLEFIRLSDAKQFDQISEYIRNFHHHQQPLGNVVPYEELVPDKKWKEYYQTDTRKMYTHLKSFSHFGKVSRGIATGANNYFCVNELERKKHQLSKKYFVPCLTKSHQVTNNFFNSDDYKHLLEKNSPVQLLQIDESDLMEDPFLQNYIEYGEISEIQNRYLTKHRNPWYKSETREPAPILVNVFSRNKLKFIRNEAKVRNLTAFHCIYINSEYSKDTNLFMAYFMTEIGKEILNYNSREYGKGLKKFEPGDLNKSLVVDVGAINADDKKSILDLYSNIRGKQRMNNGDAEADLKKLNALFLKILSS